MDRRGEHLVPDDREGEQEAEAPVPGGVEDEARGDDERPPALRAWLEQPRERQHEHEEDREGGGREEHASRVGRGGGAATPAAVAAGASRSCRLPRRPARCLRRSMASHDGSSGRPLCGTVVPYTSACSRIELRAAAHSAAATRSQAPTITPAITGASRPAAAASAATAMRKRISTRSHGTARPRARGVSTDRTQLGLSRTTGRPSSQPGCSPFSDGRTRVSWRSACTSAWRPSTCDVSERTAPTSSTASCSSGSRETCVVSDGSATVAGSALVGGLHLVERCTALLVHLGAPVFDRLLRGGLVIRLVDA